MTKKINKNTELLSDRPHSKGAVSPPIYQSSLFTFDCYEDLQKLYAGQSRQPIYSRVTNPTVELFEEKMALLENGEAAAAFSSGIGAISNIILGLVKQGDRIVAVNNIYPDTYRLLKQICHKFGIETDFVEGNNLSEIEQKIIGAKIIYLESPNTWVMEEQNLRGIAELAKRYNVISVIDNSWASPIFQNPIDEGIDIVIHSASKYLSGHSDVVAGVAIGSKDLITRVKNETAILLGAKLSAHEASLLLRGLRTLKLRLKQHEENGLYIAKKLKDHKLVRKVNHPALHKNDNSSLKGYGSLMSFELADGVDIPLFCNELNLFRLGVSWGGYESLVLPALLGIKKGGNDNSAVDFGVSEKLIRIFIGLEDKNDLWSDIKIALKKASGE